MSGNQRTRDKIVEAVAAPLGFFVLALLIAETFLVAVLLKGNFDTQGQFIVMGVGASMFFSVLLIVTWLVHSKPENLTFDKEAHLKRSEAAYGTELKTVDRKASRPSETDQTNGS